MVYESMYRDMGAFFATLIILSLFIFMSCMRSFDKKLRQHFTFMIVAMLVAIAAFVFDDYLARLDYVSNLRYLTKIVKNVAEGFAEVQVILVVDGKLNRNKIFAYSLPFIITSAIIMSAPVNLNVFYFDAANNYIRGNLGYLIYVEGIVYSIEVIYACRKKWASGFYRDAITIIVMVLQVILSIILEEEGIFHCSILPSSCLGISFLYMYSYAERYNVDSVTHCYKRRCFYSDGARFGGHTMAVVSMDLNDLKKINDNFGHKAGDTALLTFANICKDSITQKFIVYRTGGDEFMMLGIRATRDEAQEVVNTIQEKLKQTSYSSSFGIAMYREGDDFDEIVVKADKAMYADKKAYKRSNKRSHSRETEESGSISPDDQVIISNLKMET